MGFLPPTLGKTFNQRGLVAVRQEPGDALSTFPRSPHREPPGPAGGARDSDGFEARKAPRLEGQGAFL
ncbi:MAG: hypothetical protein CL917_08880 [Deltaproteobacteria bacterium]|nr:hypothetical protein [Deltaproteobacteria bacterium]